MGRKRRGRPGPFPLALALVGLTLLAAAPGAGAEPALPDGFQDSVAIPGLNQPTTFRFAPDGRVFVAEKGGRILVFDGTGDAAGEPSVFADLSADVYDHGDRGLLGMVLDPDFPAEPYVYALYTFDHVLGDSSPAPRWGDPESPEGDHCSEPRGSDDCVVSGRLVRLEADASGEHAEQVGGQVEQAVLAEDWCQQFSSHSVGDLEFGPEGALYASGGDGASFTSSDYGQFGDPPNPCGEPPGEKGEEVLPESADGGSYRAQNLGNLSGTIIRVDPDSGEAWEDNPQLGPDDDPRIVAYGFRNPFRFALDPRTGEIYAGNVGSSEIEEIDRFSAPPASTYNSGWPCYEGVGRQYQFVKFENPICERLYEEEEDGLEPASQPLFHYPHAQPVVGGDECPAEYGSAISGVAFYEGEELPEEYRGAFFFADSVRGCVYVMFPGKDGRPDPEATVRFMREDRIYPGVDIREGPDGSLYYASLFGDENYAPGAIHRIYYVPGVPRARLTVDRAWDDAAPYEFLLDAGGSDDPAGEALRFDWDLDGDGEFELSDGGEEQGLSLEDADVTIEGGGGETEYLNRIVTVRVTDSEGLTSAAKLTLYPGDAPPTPEITTPVPGPDSTWKVGDQIGFSGTARDAEGGVINEPNYFHWSSRLYHCPGGEDHCHAHPLQTFKGVTHGDLLAPEHDVPTFIQLTLRVTDRRGLSGSETVRVDPRVVDLALESSPPGISLNAGVFAGKAPLIAPAIEGAFMELTAPSSAEINGTVYEWKGWSDGGGRSHTVVADPRGQTTYVAEYAPVPQPQPAGGEDAEGREGRGEDPGRDPAGGEVGESRPGAWRPDPRRVNRRPLFRLHPPRRTRRRFARFVFIAGLPRLARYRCKLDRRPVSPCRPRVLLRRLRPGWHVLRVAATYPSLRARTKVAAFRWFIQLRLGRVGGWRARTVNR